MMNNFKYPRSRWFMLGLFMFLTVVIELQWLTRAPNARDAEIFYSTDNPIFAPLRLCEKQKRNYVLLLHLVH